MNRRDFFNSSVLGGLGFAAAAALPEFAGGQLPMSEAKADFKITKGNIRQSIMGWTFKERMEMQALAKLCAEIGFAGMEGISRDLYPQVKELGMEIALVGSHGFAQGPCNPENKESCIEKLTDAINVAAEVGSPSAITFTGMRFDGMNEAEAAKNCVDVWKSVMPLAEDKGVQLVLEHLNSRDDSHPMKGHPGYFGDNVDFCVDLISDVNSPNMKLLFDIYHVSIMNGDIIRRIRQYKDVIGHYHTAGNPGRAEMDNTQEINYPPIMREILATGYKGFVAQEFIPEWDDHELALRHAAMLCDV
ncbi:MAG: hydroxypyruvate isomerase [Verrucomicrobiales bacterium]|jgi:hydroxypyruvate isomerase